MKKVFITIFLAFVASLTFAQLTSSGSIGESYRNFMVQSTSFLNPHDFVSFEPIGGTDRFFSEKWENGGARNLNDAVIANKDYQFNYDFLKHELYAKWKDTIITVDNNYLKSFYIYNGNSRHNFCKILQIDPENFVELLSADTLQNKIMLLKKRTTSIRKGDKASPGSNYLGNFSDAYNSKTEYFLLFPDKASVKINISKKNILEKLQPSYKRKAETILSSERSLNDTKAINLINALNQ
ncbi:MAG: hypothetical protein EOP43_05140 [Sphingobacteriaceae bacterium]|nr:MAG: hypothetical protein EOP43_05140 [Sphingobacteriaceae bacterium]